ncbi:uncharacterized protein [Diabrotica undecimpunctata]|uniref:uncharacterized protein n=1 Tax=Diabrotica undecimpunctata TaxID=50387 RepID=UPI003B640934
MGLQHALSILLLINIFSVYGKLTGDHICLTEKLYLANVTENYLKNVILRNYKWCLNFPPRCSFYTTKQVSAVRVVEKNQTKVVEECCANFVEKDDHCISSCPSCINGICENGHCNCLAGFKGNSCELVCSNGEWGPNCARTCECNSRSCDSINGVCMEQSSSIPTEISKTSTTLSTTVTKLTTVPTLSTVPVVSTLSTVPSKPTVPTIPTVPTTVSTIPTVPTISTIIPTVPKLSTKLIVTTEENIKTTSTIATTTKKTQATTEVNNVEQNINKTVYPSDTGAKSTTNSTYISDTASFSSRNETVSTIRATEQTPTTADDSLVPTVHAVTTISSTTEKQNPTISGLTSPPVDTEKNKYTTRIFSNGSIATNDGLLIPVEVEYGRLKSDVHENNSIKPVGKEDYLNRDMSEKRVSFNDFALFGITVLLALMIVVVILVVNILRKRKVEQGLKAENNHQVAVFSATIYHSAVPEIVEYEYDHPPSSSYRTTSVFRTNEVTEETIPEYQPEPIYDEIPNKVFEPTTSSIPPTSIYINTCESTKF